MSGPVIYAPPPKAAAADVDTGTNDVKYLTAKALADASYVPFGAPGSEYNVLASNGTAWTVQALSTILGVLKPIDIQVFDTSDTWTKPANVQVVVAIVFGAGGGAGSGRRASTGSPMGGEGGCAGGCVIDILDASVLAGTEDVVIGAGGTGGPARTTGTANGVAGNPGGYSSFADIVLGGGGRQGRGGTDGGPTTAFTTVDALQDGSTSFAWYINTVYTGSGSTIAQPSPAHTGSGDHGSSATVFGTRGGNSPAGLGGENSTPTGGDGSDAATGSMAGGSGGGGGLNGSDGGGNGGHPSGGGGGGAYGDNGGGATANSGAGGDGADGRVIVISFG